MACGGGPGGTRGRGADCDCAADADVDACEDDRSPPPLGPGPPLDDEVDGPPDMMKICDDVTKRLNDG